MRKVRLLGLLWMFFISGKARKRREQVRLLPRTSAGHTMREVSPLF